MRCLLPHVNESLNLDQLASLYAYPSGGCTRANMVTTLDGAATADGKSDPISGAPDKYMFGVLRALADVIVVGAGTVRAEGYGPGRQRSEFAHLRAAASQAPVPIVAVVTRTANLDPASALFTDAKLKTIVMTCESANPDARKALADVADVAICGEDDVDLVASVELLVARGLNRILTEGGPSLLGDFIAADLLDELALSISPVIAGGDAARIVNTNSVVLQRMQLRTLVESEEFLFALYEHQRQVKS